MKKIGHEVLFLPTSAHHPRNGSDFCLGASKIVKIDRSDIL